jgi:hypothetical protein
MKSMISLLNLPDKKHAKDPSKASHSSFNLKHGSSSERFGYKVAYESEQYHIVRNKALYGNENSITILPNKEASGIPIKLANVQMHLQSNRPPNLAQAHDRRFENINRDPSIFSKTRKSSTIDLQRLPKRETSFSLIKRDIAQNFYDVKDTQVKQKSALGSLEMKKQGTERWRERDSKHGLFTPAKHDSFD